MNGRAPGYIYFLTASLLNGVTALSIFYLSGLITTIGSALQIPYILSGFAAGSVIFPIISYLLLRQSRRRLMLSALSVPAAFLSVALYVSYSKIVGNDAMALLSLTTVAGNLFIVSLFIQRTEGGMVSAIAHGLGGMFVMTVMLVVYASLFDTHMPFILVTGLLVTLVLLIAVAFFQERRRAAVS